MKTVYITVANIIIFGTIARVFDYIISDCDTRTFIWFFMGCMAIASSGFFSALMNR